MAIDLTGGEVRVIGNLGDEHTFRLNNPEGQELINSDGEYEAAFGPTKDSISSPVELDLTEVDDGTLIFQVTIANGFYRIHSLIPRRTLLTIEVESE